MLQRNLWKKASIVLMAGVIGATTIGCSSQKESKTSSLDSSYKAEVDRTTEDVKESENKEKESVVESLLESSMETIASEELESNVETQSSAMEETLTTTTIAQPVETVPITTTAPPIPTQPIVQTEPQTTPVPTTPVETVPQTTAPAKETVPPSTQPDVQETVPPTTPAPVPETTPAPTQPPTTAPAVAEGYPKKYTAVIDGKEINGFITRYGISYYIHRTFQGDPLGDRYILTVTCEDGTRMLYDFVTGEFLCIDDVW